jgi:hypothetical protein
MVDREVDESIGVSDGPGSGAGCGSGGSLQKIIYPKCSTKTAT